MNKIIQKFFLAVVWGFGSHLEVNGREQFNDFMQMSIGKFMTNDPSNEEHKAIGFRKRLDYSVVPTNRESLFS